MMFNKIKLLANLDGWTVAWVVPAMAMMFAVLFFTYCSDSGGGGDIEVSVFIRDISRIDSDYAFATVQYAASGANITEVGVLYSTTLGRLNVGAFDSHSGANTPEFGIVSGIPSVTGTFGADLAGLMHSTTYYVVPYIKLDKATGEFYKGYFVPTGGHKDFLTLADENSTTFPPSVSACTVSNVSYTTASFRASVTSAGRPGFTDRGFCYGTERNPARDGNNSVCVRSTGTTIPFSQQVSGLNDNTTYYVRAYIVNESHGTRYGTEAIFRTLREAVVGNVFTFTDGRDGREYKAVDMDGTVWMAENLDYTVDSSWCYENYDFMCQEFGRLYTWDAAMEACPIGWYLPDSAKFGNLIRVVGSNAGGKLKSQTGWNSGNGTDDFGFTALPGGTRGLNGSFSGVNGHGSWWSASEGTGDGRIYYFIGSNSNVSWHSNNKDIGYSIRCVRGNPILTTIVSPEGSGTVTHSPNQESYSRGAVVTITAVPDSGYVFWRWLGDGVADKNSAITTVSMLTNRTVTVEFFRADSTFLDSRDGQRYRVVRVGNITWMAENLNFEQGGSRCYGNIDSNCVKYGRLYNDRSNCPRGWRLPSRVDWNNLVNAAGGRDMAGGKLKSQVGWDGTDELGFSALPGGSHQSDGFRSVDTSGSWWSSTTESINQTGTGQGLGARFYYWRIVSNSNSINELFHSNNDGTFSTRFHSIRCIQN
jgi:uncharacterized protein (TIGR02145 family)